MYTVVFSDTARKQLRKLDAETQRRILIALTRIRIRPFSYLTRLVGDPGYRLRVGDYRVIIDVHRTELNLVVIKVGHRGSIYKRK
ncbi:MAG: type II toxin-antitoxin system RelE/ParE family toxin [archaeon]